MNAVCLAIGNMPGLPREFIGENGSQLFGVDLDPEVLRWSRDRPEGGSGDAPLRRQGRCRCRERRRPSPYPRDLLDDQPPTARAFETRRTTLPISQQIQRLRRSVLNPEVISFGEKGPQREPNGP
jgi:hypothetical protein